jgi:DNA-binding transcriptional LysR family regulator
VRDARYARNDDLAYVIYRSCMLRVDRMRVLREVARQGSFSAAADALHLTQPAVSRHVAKLERETGMRLVDRLPGRLRLTDAGRALVEHAETLMAALSAADRSLDALRGAKAGTLRIASFPSAAVSLVAGALRAFRRAHPDVEVSFVDAQSNEALEVVRAGEADVALAFGPAPADAAGLRLLPLLSDRLKAALPLSHPLATRERLRLQELRDEGWIVGTAATLTIDACRAAGFEPRIVARTDQQNASHAFVAAGLGVTLVTSLRLVHPSHRMAVIAVTDPEVEREVYAATLDAAPVAPPTARFLALLERQARSLR